MTTLGEVYRMYRMCRRCTEGVQKVYRRNVQKVEGKESCMRSHWLVVRPSRHAQTRQGTGSKPGPLGAVTSTHIVVSVQRPDSSERPWVYLCTFC